MTTFDYTRDITGLDKHHARLYSRQYQAVIRDSVEQGLLGVSPFYRLHEYADPTFVMAHAYFVEDGNTAVLCERSSSEQPRELILETTGVLWTHHVYPFSTRQDLFLEGEYSPFGTQSITVAGIGMEQHAQSLTAIDNIHVLAGLRRQDGALREISTVNIDNEIVLAACTNVCTPMKDHRANQDVVQLTKEDDPEGVIAAFIKKRSGVVTEDNIVGIYLGEKLSRADEWVFHPCSGKLLRRGQVVKLELGFRLVSVGSQFALRIDLKAVSIINEDIAQALAFSERMEKQAFKRQPITLGSAGPSVILKRARSNKDDTNDRRNKVVPAQDSIGQASSQEMDELPFNNPT